MRPRPEQPGPGQESVWDYPRPPALVPSSQLVEVVLGGVVIGDHAVIGANAVVVTDVPAGGVAVGVPAVVKRRVADFFNDAPPSSPKRMV